MNVDYSDNITNITKNLRENIYCTDEFKNIFSNKLKKTIYATDTSFVPDQFGGWSVNVSVNREKCEKHGIDQSSSSYVGKISNALISTIHDMNHHNTYKNFANNLANVVITGENSIIVKL